MSEHPAIAAVEVSKAFGGHVAVDRASMQVPRGHLVALLGPSGSGKTTLLRTIAGFEAPDSGSVAIGGRVVADAGVWVEPERRHVGMVFQDGALFPHLTVAGNLAFGGPAKGRAEACLELVGLADRGRSYPHEMSGGERQRVALARALAVDPEVVLLDEPFGSLDTALRVSLREDVARILKSTGASALLVTHDQQEALSLADEVVVMRDGRVIQTGTPREVYQRPRSRWVAEFLGDAEVLPGTATAGRVECELGRFSVELGATGTVEVVVRPESVRLGRGDEHAGSALHGSAAEGSTVEGRVVGRSFFGHDQLVSVALASGTVVRSRGPGSVPWNDGDLVRVWIDGSVTAVEPEQVGAGVASNTA